MFNSIAKKIGRTLIITPRDAYLLNALEKADEIDRIKDLRVYRDLKPINKGWEKFLKNSEREISYIDPKEISKDPDKFIVCFSLFDIKNLLDIKPYNGTYIYSSSEAFEEESEYPFIRLYNWLKFFKFKIVGFEIIEEGARIKPQFTKGYHASGHVSKSDLVKIIGTIDPDIIIPVHTDNPEWFSKNFDNAVLLKDDEKYTI